MKKKGYKQMQRRLLRERGNYLLEVTARHEEEARRIKAESEAEQYKDRFRKFGSNVETVDPENGKYVELVKWELKPEMWGSYSFYDARFRNAELVEIFQRELVEKIVNGLIERDLVQFYIKDPNEAGGPLGLQGTYAAKLYVVPWEQMAHRRTIEIMQYAEKSLAWPQYEEETQRETGGTDNDHYSGV